ncbi:PAS domain-containing protein [uncultured Draconibacterium sp.]|uniref:PAS domain-containing protein n=1 Tax=uncultured Draconibacterium sp. TaxID=1573823 RepID=UPI0029C7E238|nr:PAS domain-containing protein [uncultured Draconibacterium sp.]
MDRLEMDYTNAEMLRKKAEELLKDKQQKENFIKEETDMKKLLHELQVHQIELEMQNEELRQAYETAETALKKYTMLFDLSPMGYFTLDSDGTICELNFRGAEMLGERRFSLINSNFKLFISEDSKPVFNNFFRKIYSTNANESCEVLLGYDKKPLCPVYMEGVVTEEDQKCLLSVVNISKFK